MTNYSDRRQQQAEARQQQVDRNNRDFIRGMNGQNVPSVWGQIGLQQSKNNNPADYRNLAGGDFSDDTGGAGGSSQPWLPGVDKWLAGLPKKIFYIMGAVGAICGFGYASSAGDAGDAWLYALGGGFAGLCFIHLLAKLFKLAVGLALVGLAGGLIYYFCFAQAGH